ncbi:MAG: hypothetical protein ACYCQI_12545 [Gammaproteobacteria bacterium]
MKKAFALTLLIFVFASPVWAVKPACPKASDIQNNPNFHDMHYTTWDGFAGYEGYTNRDNWFFIMGHIEASSVNDALDKAKIALSTLTFSRGPIQNGDLEEWLCYYNVKPGYKAWATIR